MTSLARVLTLIDFWRVAWLQHGACLCLRIIGKFMNSLRGLQPPRIVSTRFQHIHIPLAVRKNQQLYHSSPFAPVAFPIYPSVLKTRTRRFCCSQQQPSMAQGRQSTLGYVLRVRRSRDHTLTTVANSSESSRMAQRPRNSRPSPSTRSLPQKPSPEEMMTISRCRTR